MRLLLVAGALATSARAQPQDPLMQLMMSQPPVDLASPVVPTATFDPPVVHPGEQAIYRVTFNALEEAIAWPEQIKAPAELELRPGARAQTLQNTGGGLRPLTFFNCRVRASKAGTFTVPEFVVQVDTNRVTVPAARLEVIPNAPRSASPAGRLVLELARTNLFVGQAVVARVLLFGSENGVVQSLQQVQLTGQGFITDPSSVRQRPERINRDGANPTAYVYETTLTPISAGKIELFAQALTAGLRFSGAIVIQGSGIVNLGGGAGLTLLESEPITLEARPVPPDGALPGFTGAIGKFTIGALKLATNVLKVGDPANLTITIENHGPGNAARLVPPAPPRASDWLVFPAVSAGASSGSAAFTYSLVVLTEGARSTPKIPFSFFDPEHGTYADLTIPSLAVTVRAGAAAAEARGLLQTNWAEADSEPEPALSGLAAAPGLSARSLIPLQQQAWFPFVQGAPAVLLVALWGWDRRRRYLEVHPDILLRRHARRALRRQRRAMQRAAQAGDAPAFAAAAVSAIREACAPHFPAEPRALVGGDVLKLLSQPFDESFVPPTGLGVRRSYAAFQTNFKTEGKRHGTAALHDASAPLFAVLVSKPREQDAGAPDGPLVTDVIRRFFAVTDASRFSAAPADASGLLALQPQLEQLLEELEERL